MGLICSTVNLRSCKLPPAALLAAVREGDSAALTKHLLVSKTRLNGRGPGGMAPLHIAAEMGDVRLVSLLVAMGADPDLRTGVRQGAVPPLVLAATHGHTAVVRVLLAAGAAADGVDGWGCSAVFKAATYNHVDCVKLLLQAGADLNRANRWGALPLQYAALQGHHKVIRVLLKGDCDVGADGEPSVPPPLAAAAMRGHHKCVSALLDAGAPVDKPHAVAAGNRTALYYAIRHCQHALNEFSSCSKATVADRLRCIKLLLGAGAKVSADSVRQLCVDDFFPEWTREVTQCMEVLLVRLILRALPARAATTDAADDSDGNSEDDALRTLFRDVAMTLAMNAPLVTELMRLLCSVGFRPTDADVNAIDHALQADDLAAVEHFRRNPRSLQDACRQAIRSSMSGNVLACADQLPLPRMLKDYITLRDSSHYSL